MNENNSNNKIRTQAGVGLVVLGVVLAGSAIAFSGKGHSSATMVSSTTSQSTSSSEADSKTIYKNGTYSATGSYDSPGGEEHVRVTLTLSSNVITTANVQSGANDPTAQTYQDSFISGYKSQVVGKKISTIKLSNVSGSSLTSQGFNDALNQIENQAKA
jgi:hypothetical protein